MLAFSEGGLKPSEMESVHAHLDGCADCQELVSATVHQFGNPPAPSDATRGWAANFTPGRLIAGRYEVQRFLGRGGMGEVYRVLDRVLMERVALKTVLSTKSDSPRAGQRLLAEARLARRISHPNVCRVHDVGVHSQDGTSEDQLHFLTMELIEGRRLGEILRDGALSLDQVEPISRQILLGLSAAHAAGVLHRDLKSDNVMISGSLRRPRVVIADFGLSRSLDRDSCRAIGTRGHERVGSLAYMPPEQIWGGELGPESDVFGFGVVLFEMLTGVLPFRESSLEDPARRMPPPPPSALRPGVCGQLDALVLGCLNPDPGSRLRRAEHVLEVLGKVRLSGAFAPPSSLWPRTVWAALG